MFVHANFESYNTRLENRLDCNICHCYKWQDTETGHTPECRPFDCYHYYHGECLENWKAYHLEKNKGIAKIIKCSLYQSNVKGKYDNFSLLDFKFYRPNLITNDGYINHYQKVHRDFKVKFPNIMVKLKSSLTDKKETSSSDLKKLLNRKQNHNIFYL